MLSVNRITHKGDMKFTLMLLLILFGSIHAFATWSIIIIDRRTNEIGIAGASCTRNCYGIGEIVPGKGAVIVQAMSNHAARVKGVTMIVSGASPEEIIAALRSAEFDPERQQYAIVTTQDFEHALTYTGKLTHEYGGALTGNGFSIQGNTLTGESVLRKIYDAVLRGQNLGLPIHEILMMALEAGSEEGGDKRCGDQRATSAFMTVARPDERKPFMNLQIFGQAKGGQNAVIMLRSKYDKWLRRRRDLTR